MAKRGLVLLCGLLASVAHAERETTPELDAERDQLIDKITRGVEVDASVQRFAVLVKKRDAQVATSAAAVEKERSDRLARIEYLQAYRKTADYQIGWYCSVSVDPAHPVKSDENRWPVDWGRVTKKDETRLVPKNELDDGEPATVYEIVGVARTYRWLVTESMKKIPQLVANKGDLVALCDGGSAIDKRLPAAFAAVPVQRSGYAFRIASPPLIAKKTKWNPRHLSESRFFWAIRDVKWKYPPEETVVALIEIKEPLGPGQWKIDASDREDWVLEVPTNVAKKELLVPGHFVWAILSKPHFDKGLKKLVLVAEDLEERYVFEKEK